MEENLPPNPEQTVTITPVPPEGEEEKKLKRKATFKRLGLVLGISYLTTLLFIIAFAVFFVGKKLSLFDYLPISQIGFNGFLFTLFNILIGLVVAAALLFTLANLFKSMLVKKDQLEKKKKTSKNSLIGGLGFLVLTALWLAGLWFLGPKLIIEELYESPIKTDPEVTVGLSAPVTVTFDASEIPVDPSVFQILSYSWSFGDGDTANGRIASHRYTQKAADDGRYTVILNVDYMDLKSGEQFDQEFTVEVGIDNELVAADFTAKPDSGEIPLTVEFDATASYDPDGEIVSYEWDFDADGRFDDAEGVKVNHEFTQEGSFEVTLRVTDNNGEWDTASRTIESGSIGGLRAVITSELASDESYLVDRDYEFSGESSQIREGSISKYSWNFGDGTEIKSRTVNHSYDDAGKYEIQLTVTDADGNTDESFLEVSVVDEGSAPSPAILTTPESIEDIVAGTVPFEVVFDGSGSFDPDGDIVEYQWDFDGDGVIDDTGDIVTHTFTEVKDYLTELTTLDSAGNESSTTVRVSTEAQGITASLEVDQTNGEVPLTVAFDASSSSYPEGNIVNYEFDFGDGSDIHIGGARVNYRYEEVGTYQASMTALAEDGNSDTTEIQIVVRPVALTACFVVNNDSGTAPLFVAVDPSCSGGTVANYEWDFGDDTKSFDRKPDAHTYAETGTYTIRLEVTSSGGIVDSFEKDVVVN